MGKKVDFEAGYYNLLVGAHQLPLLCRFEHGCDLDLEP